MKCPNCLYSTNVFTYKGITDWAHICTNCTFVWSTKIKKTTLVCPNGCGSKDLYEEDNTGWRCYHCGAFVIEEEDDMTAKKKVNFTLDMALRNLEIRANLFNQIPSVTNMIMAFEITDMVILQTYKLGGLEVSRRDIERSLERYEKCKNLALGNVNFNERKLAFARALEIFHKLITIPEVKSPEVI